MRIIFKVSGILPKKEMYGKVFYPVSTSDVRDYHGDHIFNCLNEIPQGTQYISAELYRYYDKVAHKTYWNIKDVQPYEAKK